MPVSSATSGRRRRRRPVPLYQRPLDAGVAYRWPASVAAQRPDDPVVQNMVSVVHTDATIDLAHLCAALPSAEYCPERFAAATVRFSGRSSALVYSTGKIIVAGHRTLWGAVHSLVTYAGIVGGVRERRIVYERGTRRVRGVRALPLWRRLRFRRVEVINIVCMFRVPREIVRLDEIHRANRAISKYTPATFPAVRFTHLRHGCVLIFDTGNCIMLGLRDMQDARRTHRDVCRIITRAHTTSRYTTAVQFCAWALRNPAMPPLPAHVVRRRRRRRDAALRAMSPVARDRGQIAAPEPPTPLPPFERRIQSQYEPSFFAAYSSELAARRGAPGADHPAARALREMRQRDPGALRRLSAQSFVDRVCSLYARRQWWHTLQQRG